MFIARPHSSSSAMEEFLLLLVVSYLHMLIILVSILYLV